MEQKCVAYLQDTLSNWSIVDVRVVPGVMYQTVCRRDIHDNNTEYRFHWFTDCTETYIHNHRYTFDTYGLEGQYRERLWRVMDDNSGKTTYCFQKAPENKFGSMICLPGELRCIGSRSHFPGNTLHVNTKQFHSIYPMGSPNSHVVTFVARHICSSTSEHTIVLSSSPSIDAPIDEIRPATSEERQLMYDKLLQISKKLPRNRREL